MPSPLLHLRFHCTTGVWSLSTVTCACSPPPGGSAVSCLHCTGWVGQLLGSRDWLGVWPLVPPPRQAARAPPALSACCGSTSIHHGCFFFGQLERLLLRLELGMSGLSSTTGLAAGARGVAPAGGGGRAVPCQHILKTMHNGGIH